MMKINLLFRSWYES